AYQLLRRVSRRECALRAVLLHEVVDPRRRPVVHGNPEALAGEVARKVHPHRRQPNDGDHAHRRVPLARRRLMPSISTTMTGMSHHATRWLALRIALRTRPVKTATAIVQSSPTMK